MKLFSKILLLAAFAGVFCSCEKDGDGELGGVTSPKVCYFDAKVQISEDLIAAYESIIFEYKDADGKKVEVSIDPSKLTKAKYDSPVGEIDVLEWTCKFDYNKTPAEVYFKPTVKLKESVSFEGKPTFIFYPKIISGVHKESFKTGYNLASAKIEIEQEGISKILNSLTNVINSIEVDDKVGE